MSHMNVNLEGIIRYNSLCAIENLLLDIKGGFNGIKHLFEETIDMSELEYIKEEQSLVQDLEVQVNMLLANVVAEYYDFLSKQWAAWTHDFMTWQESMYGGLKYKRKYANCDFMVIDYLKDYLWVGVPQETYLKWETENRKGEVIMD